MKEKKERKKKKINWTRVFTWVIIYLAIFIILFGGGILYGMILQQMLFMSEIKNALSYTNIDLDINLNSTKLVEELNESFIPAWKQAFNQTAYEQLNLGGVNT